MVNAMVDKIVDATVGTMLDTMGDEEVDKIVDSCGHDPANIIFPSRDSLKTYGGGRVHSGLPKSICSQPYGEDACIGLRWRRNMQAPRSNGYGCLAMATCANEEVIRQLLQQGGAGRVQIDSWKDLYDTHLGSLRGFLENQPELYHVRSARHGDGSIRRSTRGWKRQYVVELVGHIGSKKGEGCWPSCYRSMFDVQGRDHGGWPSSALAQARGNNNYGFASCADEDAESLAMMTDACKEYSLTVQLYSQSALAGWRGAWANLHVAPRHGDESVHEPASAKNFLEIWHATPVAANAVVATTGAATAARHSADDAITAVSMETDGQQMQQIDPERAVPEMSSGRRAPKHEYITGGEAFVARDAANEGDACQADAEEEEDDDEEEAECESDAGGPRFEDIAALEALRCCLKQEADKAKGGKAKGFCKHQVQKVYCHDCGKFLNSHRQFLEHLDGKKHLKNHGRWQKHGEWIVQDRCAGDGSDIIGPLERAQSSSEVLGGSIVEVQYQ